MTDHREEAFERLGVHFCEACGATGQQVWRLVVHHSLGVTDHYACSDIPHLLIWLAKGAGNPAPWSSCRQRVLDEAAGVTGPITAWSWDHTQ